MMPLKRFNSGEPSNIESLSILKSGILDGSSKSVHDLSDSDFDSIDDDSFKCEQQALLTEDTPVTLEDLRIVDQMLEDVFGIPIVANLIRLLLKGIMKTDNISVQALSYEVVKYTRGITGIRYLSSYGMFWAAVRNIIKTRGLVPFMDHFMIPSALSKFKKKLLDVCGISEDSLGSSGIQESNMKMWISSMVTDMNCEKLCLSLSMDGKKIHMTSDGLEDMGAGTNYRDSYTDEYESLVKMIKQNNRTSLFSAYDFLTRHSEAVSSKLQGIRRLIEKNTKAMEKNALLGKYIYVLNKQLESGEHLLAKLGNSQLSVLGMLCSIRKSDHLLPINDSVDLARQSNLKKLKLLGSEEDDDNLSRIRNIDSDRLCMFPWEDCILSRPYSCMHQTSRTSKYLANKCILSSNQIYEACGLRLTSPVQDMKNIFIRSNNREDDELIEFYRPTSENVEASLCSLIAPMIFGNNCYIVEAGIFIKQGFCSLPSFLIYDKSNNLQYAVRIVNKENNPFDVDLDSTAMCLLDSYLVGANTGCLLVQHSENVCVAFNLVCAETLSVEMTSLVRKYVYSSKIITKRDKEMMFRINSLRKELKQYTEKCSILGSFPVMRNVLRSNVSPIDSEDFYYGYLDGGRLSRNEIEISKVADELKSILEDKSLFLSKKARELVIINASDMSGIGSKRLPHTQLCASFLTSSSLKVVGAQCLNQAIEFISKCDAVEVLNIGVDGESLHLATKTTNGRPGTVLALAKHLLNLLKSLSKEFLVTHMSKSKSIRLEADNRLEEEEEEYAEEISSNIADIEQEIEDSIAAECMSVVENECDISIDDIVEWLHLDSILIEDPVKIKKLKGLAVTELRNLCLRHIFPIAKKHWLKKALGRENLIIKLGDGSSFKYVPNSIFEKTELGFFRTVTFDMAHLRYG